MSKHSVIFKLSAGYTMIVFVSLLIVGLLFMGYFRADLIDSKRDNMTARARQIALSADTYVINASEASQLEIFAYLMEGLAGSRVIVCNNSGQLMVDARADENPQAEVLDQEYVDPQVTRVLQGEELAEEIVSAATDNDYLLVGVPIYNDEQQISGAVLLISPVSGIAAAVNQAAGMLMIAILFALILTALMSFFYARIFTRPLNSMKEAAMEMARGNYDVRIGLGSKDEIGQLADALDLLASRLGYTIDQLFQEQGKLQDLITSISEGIVAYDPQMRLISCNSAARRLLEINPSDGEEAQLLSRLDEMDLIRIFREVMANGQRQQLKMDWHQLVLTWLVSPVANKRGIIVGSVALIQDSSESERLERMRREFVANVSHELRTPLTVIRGSAEALRDKAVEGEAEISKYYGRILTETRGLERLVSDLLDLARIQSGRLELKMEELDLSAIVSDVVQAMSNIARPKNIGLLVERAAKLPAVWGDYDRLRQLLIIFIDNAIRHSPEGSSVRISVAAGARLEIRIADNGPGIAAEDLPYVWERFYKADKARRPGESGTGLGLSIARSIVKLHGGEVALDSSPGQGTTVIIELNKAEPGRE